MGSSTLIFLAEISFDLGLIGLDEFRERIEVATWLADNENIQDPRNTPDSRLESLQGSSDASADGIAVSPSDQDPHALHLVALSKWHFTGADPDPYPSVPHGHYQSSSRPWPKLNPYTGRVFAAKHREDPALRLGKDDMRKIWRDESFRDYCRRHICGTWRLILTTVFG